MDKITINVTQDDIDNGTKHDTNWCPVALALKREYPEADFVTVSVENASVYIPRQRFLLFFHRASKIVRIAIPKVAGRFIRNFDAYGPNDEHVKPFSFDADIVNVEQ